MNRFPDVALVAFTMHGMGDNDTDLPTMLLLPELLYRMSFGKALFRSRDDWRAARSPALQEGEDWNAAVIDAMRHTRSKPAINLRQRALRRARRGAVRVAKATLGQAWVREMSSRRGPREKSFDIDWMPASQYARYWEKMDAFAIPSFFEGRFRINLQGREKNGHVPLERYGATLDAIEEALRACVDMKTGEPVVREITRASANDPFSLSGTQADLAILWNRSPIGFRRPTLGDIGPAPSRRMGGHSGGLGALYVRCTGVMPGERGLRSSFDVAPTILELMGRPCARPIDGESVFQGAHAAPSLGTAEIGMPSPVAAFAGGSGSITMPDDMEVELTIPPRPTAPARPGRMPAPLTAATTTEIIVMPQQAAAEPPDNLWTERRD